MVTGWKVAGRYVTGRPLDGKPRTDAGFLHRGTKTAPGYLRVSRWHLLPGWQRAAVRLFTVPAVAAAALVYAQYPGVCQLTAGTIGGRWAVRAGRQLRHRWRTRRFRRMYLRPLARSIAPKLDVNPYRPDSFLRISPELGTLQARLIRPMSPAERTIRAWHEEHTAPIIRWLPERVTRARWWLRERSGTLRKTAGHFRRPVETVPPRVELRVERFVDDELRKFIRAAVHAKLGLGDLVESWDQVGPSSVACWTVRERPPADVGLAEIAAYLPKLAEHEFIVGLTTGSRPVIVSLDDDAPHICLSAGSGAGKSVLAKLIAGQVLSRGGRVVILDRKGSHRWALGLDGVTYCTAPGDMHAALIGLSQLADDRNAEALRQPEGWTPEDRVLVIFEEMNATVAQLNAWWEANRAKSDPKPSPAVQAFRNIMFMGRSGWVNLLGIAQMLTARTTGGPESRENFGVRALARYTANNWKMLVPECPMPRRSKTRGRWQIVIAGDATETQVAFLSDSEVRELAGTTSSWPDVPASPLSGTGVELANHQGQAEPGDITLREAIDRDLFPGMTHDALKKRYQRARRTGDGPGPVGKKGNADTFRITDLETFAGSISVGGNA